MKVFSKDFRPTLNIPLTPSDPAAKDNVDDRRQVSQLQTVIKQETKLLEATEKKSSKLEQLFKALLTIPPTSVETESFFCCWIVYHKTTLTIK